MGRIKETNPDETLTRAEILAARQNDEITYRRKRHSRPVKDR